MKLCLLGNGRIAYPGTELATFLHSKTLEYAIFAAQSMWKYRHTSARGILHASELFHIHLG